MPDDAATDQSRWGVVLQNAEAIEKQVREHTPSLPSVTPVQSHIVMMFWRAVRLYNGVLCLIKAELPEEAAILARSLFEVSLHLRQLEAEPKNRDALVYRWINDSITEQLGLLKNCVQNEAVAEGNTNLEKRRQQTAKDFSGLGITKPLPFLDTKVSAKRFGWSEDKILFYEWSHESVHGTEAVWMFAKIGMDDGTVGLFGKTANPRALAYITHFAGKSMAQAAKAMFAIMGWTFPSTVREHVAKIERAFG
jgi:hypothetical protein